MLLPYLNFTLGIVKFSLDILLSYLDVLLCILEYVLCMLIRILGCTINKVSYNWSRVITLTIKIVTWFAPCSKTCPAALKQEQILNKHRARYHKVTEKSWAPSQWTRKLLESLLRFNLGKSMVVTLNSPYNAPTKHRQWLFRSHSNAQQNGKRKLRSNTVGYERFCFK